MRVLRRLILSGAIGVAVGVLSAIIITIADLYLSGHGYRGLAHEYVTWSAAGIHLSIGDMIMLGAVVVAGPLAWRILGRDAYPDGQPDARKRP